MRTIATLIVALALLAPSTALAQDGNPFDGQLPPPQATPAPTVEPADADDGNTDRNTLWAIGGGLLVLLVVIGIAISRDARSSLPADERDSPSRERDQGPHKHERQAKAKARAKSRAQRQARKASRKTRR